MRLQQRLLLLDHCHNHQRRHCHHALLGNSNGHCRNNRVSWSRSVSVSSSLSSMLLKPFRYYRNYHRTASYATRLISDADAQLRPLSSSSTAKPAARNDVINHRKEMDPHTIYGLLKLTNFTKSEFDRTFDRILQAGKNRKRRLLSSLDAKHSSTTAIEEPQEMNNYSAEESADNSDGGGKGKDDYLQPKVETISMEDLEAYLRERYQCMQDRWQEKHYQNQQQEQQPHEDAIIISISSKNNCDEQQTRMEQLAKRDANYIFQLLLEHAPPSPPSSRTTSSTNTVQEEDSIVQQQQSILLFHKENHSQPQPQPPQQQNQLVLTKDQFNSTLTTLSTSISYSTILPLSASLLLVGISVGITSPILPFIASKLHLSTSQYGFVISSLAFSKMMGNVPSAILVERHGRKPYLVYSLGVVGVGVSGMGICGDWMQLGGCRMMVGLGVAALTTASTLTVADVSTPLSRASTFSPLMSAFAAGMALGPAVGGILHDAWGIRDTFFAVGVSYGVAAIWNHLSVNETKRDGEWWEGEKLLPWHSDYDDTTKSKGRMKNEKHSQKNSSSGLASTISHAVKDTSQQWSEIIADPRVRPVIINNGFYMLALSGTQFTLLPLILTGGGATAASAGLALSASAVGQLYMWMSAVQVLGNPAAGRFADRAGKGSAIVVGGALTSVAMASVPIICAYGIASGGGDVSSFASSDVDWPLLAGTLGIWSLGGTLLATSHVAAVSDAVHDTRRSQAIALLRTAGDVGYLCGAIGAGLAADLAGDVGMAMQAGSAVLMGSTVWFGFKMLALNKKNS